MSPSALAIPGSAWTRKRVVAAVAPAVEVEQRIAEECAADAHGRGDRVGRRRPHARAAGERIRPPGSASARCRTSTSENGATSAPRLRRSAGPSSAPSQSAPNHASPASSTSTPSAPGPAAACRRARRPGPDPGRRRRRPRARPEARRHRSSAGRRRDRRRRSHRSPRRATPPAARRRQPRRGGDAAVLHRPILPPGRLLPATVSRGRILWSAAMCDAPGRRTVRSCPIERVVR